MPHVTFIHGIANKPAHERLLTIWRQSLAENDGLDLGARGITSSMVYWADLMYEKPADEGSAHESTGEEVATDAADESLSWTEGLSGDDLKNALQPVNQKAVARVGELQKELKVAHLALLSPGGAVLAEAPGEAFGLSLKGIPAVQDCSAGIVRDGLYALDGKLTMVGVAPLMSERGKIVGCWLTKLPVDAGTATRLSRARWVMFVGR